MLLYYFGKVAYVIMRPESSDIHKTYFSNEKKDLANHFRLQNVYMDLGNKH